MTTWLKKNLFRSPGDAAITIIFSVIIAWVSYRLLRFIFVTGRWDIVRANLSLFLTGAWPSEELTRLAVVLVALTFIGALGIGYAIRRNQDAPDTAEPLAGFARVRDLALRFWPAIVVVLLLLSLTSTLQPWLLVGAIIVAGIAGRVLGGLIPISSSPLVVVGLLVLALASIWYLNAGVGWNDWGGMMLNVFFAAISIVLCFPIGVLLALGRRSEYPIVRWLCTVYIELFRGTPLLALLLMANVALGFFIPQALAPGKVVRAIVIFTLFTAAYVAEIVRGGLQSVPRGQIEAGKANGLTPIPIMTKIVLPQAIRNVIPALVGQFISLFKDTT
ncbi:MAG: amino acid ABC transporter permease, partial [Acidimicrobiales bacterium]